MVIEQLRKKLLFQWFLIFFGSQDPLRIKTTDVSVISQLLECKNQK